MNNHSKINSKFEFTTRRPVAILMIVVGIVVFGFVSLKKLSWDLMPEISYPSFTVRTEYPGAAPEEVENVVSRQLEEQLSLIKGLVSVTSISRPEQSDIVLEFTWGTNLDRSAQEIREKLDQVQLDPSVEKPMILRYDPSLDPVLRIGITSDIPLIDLRVMVEDEIARELEALPGVAAARVKGGFEKEILIKLDEKLLAATKIKFSDVTARLAQENINLAGGNIKEGETEYIVRTLNEFRSVKEIGDIIIAKKEDVLVRLKDIANIVYSHKERKVITRVNKRESIEVNIYKEADANIVDVSTQVKEKLLGTPEQQRFVKAMKAREAKSAKDNAQNPNPANESNPLEIKRMTDFLAYRMETEGKKIDYHILSDQAVFIENSINEVKNTAIIGGILAVIILFLFLQHFPTTVIVAIAIPLSLIAAFAPLNLFHVSLNIMSLGGLALGIGMLVDNSIVVMESIFRCREEGDNWVDSTVRGVSEVGGAVIASTLTTIAVFFPIVFVEGIAGQIFGDLSLAVVFSLLASLLVSLFFIPMLASRKPASGSVSSTTLTALAVFLPIFFILTRLLSLPFGQGVLVAAVSSLIASFMFNSVLTLREKFLERFAYSFEEKASPKSYVMIVPQWSMNTLRMFAAFLKVIILYILAYLVVFLYPLLALFRQHKKAASAVQQLSEKLSRGKKLWDTFMTVSSLDLFTGSVALHGKWLTFPFKSTAALFKKKRRWIAWPFFPIAAVSRFVWDMVLSYMYYFFRFFVVSFVLLAWRFTITLYAAWIIFFKAVGLVIVALFFPIVGLIVRGFNRLMKTVNEGYPRILELSLKNDIKIIGVVLVIFAVTILLIVPRIGSELIPEVHQGTLYINVTFPVGTPVEENDERLQDITEKIRRLEIVDSISYFAGTTKDELSEEDVGEHIGKVTIVLKRTRDIKRSEEALISNIRGILSTFTDLDYNISRPVLFTMKPPIEVAIKGYNLEQLRRISSDLYERISKLPGLRDVQTSVKPGFPELVVEFDRMRLSYYGMNAYDVASLIKNKIEGYVATKFKEKDKRVDIRVYLKDDQRQRAENIKNLIINPGGSVPIQLSSVANVSILSGPNEIRRVDQDRSAVISANISGINLTAAVKNIYDTVERYPMPPGFSYELTGQNKEMETSLGSMMLAMGLAIFLVYIVMASQFESFLHPFLIMFTIPMALIGVFIVLFVLKIPMGITVYIGMITLVGIVVNNAIILIDYINTLRKRGLEKLEAIKQAGAVRLRPILITTATTVLGLLPMAMGLGEGTEIRTPMAISIIAGLLSATFLTLVLIPIAYNKFSK